MIERKKGYGIMSIRKPSLNVSDYFNIASQMLNKYNTSDYYTISPSISSGSSSSSPLGTLFNEGLKIDLPDWAEKIEGFVPTAFGFPHRRRHIVIVKYVPKSTLDLPFIRVVFLDPSGNPAKCMSAIYKELVKGNKRSMVEKPYRITEEGNVTGVFGIPDNDGLERVVYDIECYYNYFKDFPNETDIEMVKKLLEAKDAVRRMVMETKTEHIQSTIKSCRDEIVECQERIAELEKELNEIYEAAADGMNLLEEHGIDTSEENLKKIGIPEDFTVAYTANDIVTHDPSYSPLVMIDPNNKWETELVKPNQELDEDFVRKLIDTYSAGYNVSYTN